MRRKEVKMKKKDEEEEGQATKKLSHDARRVTFALLVTVAAHDYCFRRRARYRTWWPLISFVQTL